MGACQPHRRENLVMRSHDLRVSAIDLPTLGSHMSRGVCVRLGGNSMQVQAI